MNMRCKLEGFTLLEILVALMLQAFLLAALMQVFVGGKVMAGYETALSRTQEAGRYAIDTISRDLRMAGYYGCLDPNTMINNSAVVIMADELGNSDFDNFLAGYETHATTGQFAPALSAGSPLLSIQKSTAGSGKFSRPGSDVLFISYGENLGVTLTQATGNNANQKIDKVHPNLGKGDIAILSNCESAHIFEITNNPNGNGNSGVTLTHAGNVNNPHKIPPNTYAPGTDMMMFKNRSYFVADTGRNKASGDPIYALYVKEFDSAPLELLEGVESLQLLYGMQMSATNTRYVRADDVLFDMNKVVAVRVGLLVGGVEQVASAADTRTYTLPGQTISTVGTSAHDGDRSMRKPFSTTVRLRNRRMEI